MKNSITTLRIGSRDSALAMAQTKLLTEYLNNNYPEIKTEIIGMKTSGDVILDKSLYDIGGKGLFVKELDKALLEKKTDISVHSLKDMPMVLPEKLPILCYSKREDARDVLVLPKGAQELDLSKPIGTSSLRRELQLEKIYPGCSFKSIRGNILTRLKKLDEGEYGAIVLAAAGLKRMGLEERISRYFTPEEVLPAAGQGTLAIQGTVYINQKLFDGFANDEDTAAAKCERAFVKAIGGGCATPAAAYARCEEGMLYVKGLYVPDGTRDMIFGEGSGLMEDAQAIGKALALKLLGEGKR